MSYDVDVVCPHCGRGDGAGWNYTSNMGPAWREAGADLADFNGKLASGCAPILSRAIEVMAANREEYARRFDASNGWGSMDTLIPALRELLATMQDANPGEIVRVSR